MSHCFQEWCVTRDTLTEDEDLITHPSSRRAQDREWQVWTRSGLKPRHEHAEYVVAVDIPSGRLAPGDYILMLSALDSSGNPEEVNSYSFRVVKP